MLTSGLWKQRLNGEIKMSEVKQEASFTREDYRYLQNRMRDQGKKIRLLVRILVDKKIIGEELAKSFEETANTDEILQWYLNRQAEK